MVLGCLRNFSEKHVRSLFFISPYVMLSWAVSWIMRHPNGLTGITCFPNDDIEGTQHNPTILVGVVLLLSIFLNVGLSKV